MNMCVIGIMIIKCFGHRESQKSPIQVYIILVCTELGYFHQVASLNKGINQSDICIIILIFPNSAEIR